MDIDDEDVVNPEVPASDDLNGREDVGAVAGTLYTKAWLLDMLVRLVKALEGDHGDIDDEDELDSLLTKLWDVSTEAPVACFLAENSVMDVLLPACLNADPSSYSRQVEISLGVLANTVSIPETKLADDIASNDFYRQGIVGLFARYVSDTDVLIQCCRLLNASFHCRPEAFSQWEDCLLDLNLTSEADEEPEDFSLPECFLFILKSSKNEQLLLDVAKLLEILCGNVGRFLYQFAASPSFVMSVVEAMRELSWSSKSETVCRLINCLYMVTTVDDFRKELASLLTTDQEDVILKLTNLVLNLFPTSDEDIKPTSVETSLELDDISCAFASSFSLLLSVLTAASLSNFPLLYQRDDLWLAVKKTHKLLANHRFSADDEQSPSAVLKLNIIDFVASLRVTPDINVEQYVLSKIL